MRPQDCKTSPQYPEIGNYRLVIILKHTETNKHKIITNSLPRLWAFFSPCHVGKQKKVMYLHN